MVQRNIQNLLYPASADRRIVIFSMCMREGILKTNSGFAFDIEPGQCGLLNDYVFDSHLRIIAGNDMPGINWISNREQIWNTLNGVTNVTFNGTYANDLLVSIVSKLSIVRTMAFTYFTTPSFFNVIEHVTSPNLEELTFHLNGTGSTLTEASKALFNLGQKNGRKLKRLMLISGEGFNGIDPGIEAFTSFGNALEEGAEVVILFEFENMCMQGLIGYGYERCGKIKMAQNSPSLKETDIEMIFELYFMFTKVIDDATFYIGCRKSPQQPREYELPAMDTSDYPIAPNNITYIDFFDINHGSQKHVAAERLPGFFGDFTNLSDRHYDEQRFAPPSTRTCCNPESFLPRRPILYNAPVWSNTRIDHIVYLLHDTRFMFSNGLIFQLDDIAAEAFFFQDYRGRASHRLFLSCTSQNRRWVEVYGLSEFFENVKQADFQGFWWTDVVEEIIRHLSFNEKFVALSMMCMKLDRKVSTYIVEQIQSRHRIRKYFYDSRDSMEQSLASVINGLFDRKFDSTFNNLKSVILMARSISDRDRQTTWSRVIRDITPIMDPAGSEVTIVVHEPPSHAASKFLNLGYVDEVIVPGIFSSHSEASVYSGMMQQFTKHYESTGNIVWNFIFAHPGTTS